MTKMDDNGPMKKRAAIVRHTHAAGHAIACPFCKDTHAHEHLLVDVKDPKAFWPRLTAKEAHDLLEEAPRVLGPLRVSPSYEAEFRRGLSVETRSVLEGRREEFEKKGWLFFDHTENAEEDS